MSKFLTALMLTLAVLCVIVGMLGLAVAPIVVLAGAAGAEYIAACMACTFVGAAVLFFTGL